MPSSIYVNGVSTRRPGVYADVDASALGGSALSAGNLAVVGDFPDLPPADPQQYNTANSLKGASDSYLVQTLAKLIYNPANDDRVSGQPLSVRLVNAGTSTQAFVDLDSDALLTPAMTIKSRKYGPVGNTGLVTVTSTGGNDRDVVITINGVTRTFKYVGLDLATVSYIGTDATTSQLNVKVNPQGTLRVTQSRSAIPSGALALATESWKWDSEITFVASAAGAGDHNCIVSGIRADTGAAFTETVVFAASATPTTNPLDGVKIAAITALTWTPDAAETLTISGYAFDLDLTVDEFRTVKDVLDHIGSYSAQGWTATTLSPQVGSLEAINLDRTASTSVIGATVTLTADLFRLIEEINASDLVSAEYAVSPTVEGHDQITTFVGSKVLSGGTFTAADVATTAAAYKAMRTHDIQVIAHILPDLATSQEMREHCGYMAGLGLGECNGWAATAVGETKANVKTRTAQLNTRHVAVVAQEFQTADYTGATVWLAPTYLAATLASMQASTPVGTPLTRKIVNCLDVRSSWDANDDAEEMLAAGLCFLTTDRLGFKVERSITTYQTDDNPVFSEVSANESLYTSVRDLRQNLETKIGDPGVASTGNVIKALAKDRLRYQVDNDIIKAFNTRSVTVEDLGDVYKVSVEIAVIEPVNFILVSTKVTRIPFDA